MGKVMSVAVRKAKRFNVENRAHNFLEKTKEKPIAAPKFESNLRDLDRVLNGFDFLFLHFLMYFHPYYLFI